MAQLLWLLGTAALGQRQDPPGRWPLINKNCNLPQLAQRRKEAWWKWLSSAAAAARWSVALLFIRTLRLVCPGLVSCTSDAVGRLGGHAFIIAPNDFIMKILKVFFVVLRLPLLLGLLRLLSRWPGYITWRESGAAQKAQSLCLCQAQVTSDDIAKWAEADPCTQHR